MVSAESVREQLKRLHINTESWGRSEYRELPGILLPDEEIYECVNGMYDAGFALLVATNVRVLLIDRKPLNYLTVEDLRFDMINEIDYSHRLIGAQIDISAGSHDLIFRSYNKSRLRKLINHVQHCMAEAKRQHQLNQEGQNNHLERLNQQLQLYLLAQQGHERELTRRLLEAQDSHRQILDLEPITTSAQPQSTNMREQLTQAAQAEIFGRQPAEQAPAQPTPSLTEQQFDPQRTAFARLPLNLRHRRYGQAATMMASSTTSN